MIKYVHGNIFDSKCQLICNAVNCVGVMGAGLAKQFKELYPDMFKIYKANCDDHLLTPGCVHVYWGSDPSQFPWVANVATKDHWTQPSNLEWIKEGLSNLVDRMEHHGLTSVAIPPLGCGLGRLNWTDVKALIEEEFKDLPEITVEIYEPL